MGESSNPPITVPNIKAAPNAKSPANTTSTAPAASARRRRRGVAASGRSLRGSCTVSEHMIGSAVMVGSGWTKVKRAICIVTPSLSDTVPHPSFM